jgi:tetratricopeptide (TPR) repeat protein
MRACLLLLGLIGSAFADERTDAQAHFRRGVEYFDAKQYRQAVDEFSAAHRALPLPEFLFNIGRAHAALGDDAHAREFLMRYLARDPDGRTVPAARALLVEVAMRSRPTGATASLPPELRPLPKNPPNSVREEAKAHFTLGTVRLDGKRYADAIAEYTAAYRTLPLPELLYNIGRSHDLAGSPVNALEFYLRYLGADPDGRISTEARERCADILLGLEAEHAKQALVGPKVTYRYAREKPSRTTIALAVSGAVIAVGVALGVGLGVGLNGDPYAAAHPYSTFHVTF